MFVELPMHDMVMAESQNVFRPGRSHAAMMLKMVIAHSFLDYDCTLDKDGGCKSMQWRSAIVLKANVKIRTKRQCNLSNCHKEAA